ncbi:MAG: hypothetical protein BIFFINMI_01010 [Phycisphaerae bacterium]|nr:hypothetical protein [Phycisphaerae bacterium]
MTANRDILYAGDAALNGAAAYLAGLMTHAGLAFDYVASDQPFGAEAAGAGHRLYILSDYPVKNFNFTAGQLARLVERVRAGDAGLLMIGGWESFHGAAGEYPGTPVADALPVRMLGRDDRVNCFAPCLVRKSADHAILAGLPLEQPPGVGGFNRVVAGPDARVLLEAERYTVAVAGDKVTFAPAGRDPLLVVGQHGRGRVAAFASDVAPHWVGGLVDWGDARVKACAPGAGEIEVGNHYAQLFTRLIRWTMGDD